jgi:hypothetical protein
MNKNNTILVYAVIIVGLFVLSYFGSSYVGLTVFNFDEDVAGEYNYTGLFGKIYDFEEVKVGENTRHVLTYKLARPSSDGGFNVIKTAKVPFRYGPEELEEISLDYFRNHILFAESVYITRDKNLEGTEFSPVAIPTIGRILDSEWDSSVNLFDIPTLAASTTVQVDDPVSVISCAQSNEERMVIELRHGNENKIYWEEDCIVMESKNLDDSIKVATAAIYHIMGII